MFSKLYITYKPEHVAHTHSSSLTEVKPCGFQTKAELFLKKNATSVCFFTDTVYFFMADSLWL